MCLSVVCSLVHVQAKGMALFFTRLLLLYELPYTGVLLAAMET